MRKPVDIFGRPYNNAPTAREELEDYYGETIDFLSEVDGDE